MSIYAIGDLHLSFDERIEKPMDVFGTAWHNHYVKLKQCWEETIKEEDIAIICGDLSWGLKLEEAMADLDWIHDLPGKKIITKGNHDLWWSSISKLNKLYDDMYFLQNKSFITEEGVAICGSRGWSCPGSDGFDEHDQKIYDREVHRLELSLEEARRLGAKEIIASLHYPPTNDKHQESGFTKLLSEYGVRTCIYGHLHGKDAFKNGIKGIYNGVEYRLVSLDFLEACPVRII